MLQLKLLLTLAAAVQQQPADNSAVDFKRTVLAEWEKLDKEVRFMRLEQSTEIHSGIKGNPRRLTTKRIVTEAFSALGKLYGISDEEFDENLNLKRTGGSMTIENLKYQAEIRRGKESNSWLLVKCDQTPQQAIEVRAGFKFPWLICMNIFLPEWIADECFVISRIERIEANSPEPILRVHFVHDESQRKSLNKQLRIAATSGHIDFSPDHRYRVAGYRIAYKTNRSEGVETATLKYATKHQVPVLEQVDVERPDVKSKDFGTGSFHWLHAYKIDYESKPSQEEFRLSHYGLPEPFGIEWRRPTPIYIWLLASAGVVAVFALAVRYLARRAPSASN